MEDGLEVYLEWETLFAQGMKNHFQVVALVQTSHDGNLDKSISTFGNERPIRETFKRSDTTWGERDLGLNSSFSWPHNLCTLFRWLLFTFNSQQRSSTARNAKTATPISQTWRVSQALVGR